MRILILGGTTEANALVWRIAERGDLDSTLSLAGRTRNPAPSPIRVRVGGFGGSAGLRDYLTKTQTHAVIDATHPFAAQMSRHAAIACSELALPLAVFTRPPWRCQTGDRWTCVADVNAATQSLGKSPRTVFLTIGARQLAHFACAPQHRYIIRTIEPPDAISGIPSHRLILARGPFSIVDEIALMRRERVDVLVTKNSGGSATEAKLAAARALGIDVVMIERPVAEALPTFDTVDDVLAWIQTHRPTP